ncbi:MAG: NifU family protein [Bdellovibrionaceae bacterium]|nr:NifU family protein [Pseudobdellovibrionaceae bacterium]|tara:strand:+ start:4922 stop:5485 length:564 start_codon:yes stop_codon:yes gene_type:complete
MSQEPVYVSLEFTPNPNTLKYSVNRVLIEKGVANFTSLEKAQGKSLLATEFFQIEGIEGVMIGKDFVTVTKSEAGDWDHVHKSASHTLESFLNENKGIAVDPEAIPGLSSGTTETEKQIIDFIEKEVRPAVAMDGGDIVFDRYEDQVVYLHLQGSCAGCPSATATLKMGIENRLRELLPEIKEVVSV